MGGRRAARRTALVLLYQWDVTGQGLASLFEGEIDPYARTPAMETDDGCTGYTGPSNPYSSRLRNSS